jgi:Zn-dependent peptidase ImmA (M78 family)/DNA-binding XRE family transcriptional regulator
MPISQQELGRRLRAAREVCGMTQAEVGRYLGLSRATVAQMELGNRAVTSLELDQLASFFGREMGEFFDEEFSEEDALGALFRAHPDVIGREEVVQSLRHCLALGRELVNLERLLEVDQDLRTPPVSAGPSPGSKWEAIQQGTRAAEEERRRLRLGTVPIAAMEELLESQGVRACVVAMPEDVSGFTLCDRRGALIVVANERHHLLRRRFSLAHEYAHGLLDRERLGTVSRSSERHTLLEVRANAFAVNFLTPEEGIRQFMAVLGKGRAGRRHAEVYDEVGAVRVLAREEARSQNIQMYDVAQLAHHFGVSRLAALYQFHNLGFLTEAELAYWKAQEDAGRGKEVAALLGLPEPDHTAAREAFRHRFLTLGLEALRRDKITRAKFAELARLVALPPEQEELLLRDTGLEDRDRDGDVLLPGA